MPTETIITEEAYIEYFTGLASKHKKILHGVNNRATFFFIPIAMDLKEIDNAIRNNKATPLMALDAMHGNFDDGLSARYLQTINGQFTILDKVENGKQTDIRRAQAECLTIGTEILGRMTIDFKNKIALGLANFTIHNVQFDPVGPMAMTHFGYTFRFTITCPFSFKVDSGNWTDK